MLHLVMGGVAGAAIYTRGLACVRMHFPVFAFPSVRCSDTQGTQADAELAENQEAARRVSTDEEARIVPLAILYSVATVGIVSPWMLPYTANPPALLQEGVSVNCMLSLFLEYWCKVTPVLNLERTDVSDGISEPVCLFQCFYRSVKVCHIVPFGKIYTPLRIVESIFTQDYSYLEIGVVIWLSINLFKV